MEYFSVHNTLYEENGGFCLTKEECGILLRKKKPKSHIMPNGVDTGLMFCGEWTYFHKVLLFAFDIKSIVDFVNLHNLKSHVWCGMNCHNP